MTALEIARIGLEALDDPNEKGKEFIQLPIPEFRHLCEAVVEAEQAFEDVDRETAWLHKHAGEML
jgi:hypothetical protein